MAATESLLSYQFLRKFRVTAYVNIWALICVRTCIQRNFSIRQYLSSSPIKFLLINISKFAPLMQLTIPRLELCAAALLSKLYKKAISALSIPVDESYLWTDSSIVSTWIQGPSNKWKTFQLLNQAYGEGCMSQTQCYEWFKRSEKGKNVGR